MHNKYLIFFCCVLLSVILLSCSNKANDSSQKDTQTESRMESQDESSTSAFKKTLSEDPDHNLVISASADQYKNTDKEIVIQLHNQSETDNYIYGQYWKLEKEADDSWQEMQIVEENVTFTDEGGYIYPGETGELICRIHSLYGDLQPDHYRITMGDMWNEKNEGNKDKWFVPYIEFDVLEDN